MILFRTARLPRTVFYEGWAGDNLLVSYELPRAGAAVMLGSLAAQLRPGQASPVWGCRERERERPESILQLTTVTTSPASSAQQPPATLIAPVKASKSGGWEAFVTIFWTQW